MAHTHFVLRIVMIALALLWIGNARIEWPTASAAAQPLTDDVRNGWYKQFPPVSRAMAEARVSCLSHALRVDGIAVEGYQIRSLPVGPVMPGESGLGPAEIVWDIDNHTWTSDATLTALFPEAAYVEIMRAWERTARRNAIQCASPGDPVLVAAPSPIGESMPCPEGVRGPCFQARGGPPLVWTGCQRRQVEQGGDRTVLQPVVLLGSGGSVMRALIALLFAVAASAQPLVERVLLDKPGHKVDWSRYAAASAAHAFGHAMDAASTRDFTLAGACEANPVFRAKGEPCKANLPRIYGVKTGLLVGSELAKYLAVRKWPRLQRPFDVLGFSAGGFYGTVAWHNWRGVPYRFGVPR